MTANQTRVITVLQRMIDMCKEDEDYSDMFHLSLDEMLDDIQSQDGFGTEGQCDPRGDQRDCEYSMGYVQGVDD